MTEHIQIDDTAPSISYTATAAQTVFAVPFAFFADADLVVQVDTDVLTITTEYTVSGAGDSDGGSVTLVSGLTGGETVIIQRELTIERTTDFPASGPFLIDELNTELDRMVAMIQQIQDEVPSAQVQVQAIVDEATTDVGALVTAAESAETNAAASASAASASASSASSSASSATASASAAATSESNAADSEAAAEAAAAGVNLPPIIGGDANKYLKVKGDETGYEHSSGAFMEGGNNLSDVSNAATAFANIKQAATESATGVVEEATAAEILAGTADKFIEAEKLEDAMEPVALADGANIAVNLATGVYFTVTLGGNRTLSNPTNHKIGRTIAVRVTQGAGGQTLTYDTQYDFGQDVAPTLSTGAGVVDILFFYVLSATKMVYLGIRKGV